MLYQEEVDAQEFLGKSVYEFADLNVEMNGSVPAWGHPAWIDHAVPFAYIYQDYRLWCSRERQDYVHYLEGPGVMTVAQFGVAIRRAGSIEWDTSKATVEHYGMSRRVTRKRRCNRTGRVKHMVMYRGIKHPDGYVLHAAAGRPTFDRLSEL
jgi:hypothetical protein